MILIFENRIYHAKEMIFIVRMVLRSASQLRTEIAMRGYTEKHFARVIKISHSYLSQILNKRCNPSPTTARKIAEGIGTSIPHIFLVKQLAKAKQRDEK